MEALAIMNGAVTWQEILVLGTLVVLASGSGYLVAWRLQVLRSRDRSVVTRAFEVEIARLQAKIDATDQNIEARITAIEHFNAGTIVVLEHMKEFREEIKMQFTNLQMRRTEDMQRLHTRLDTMWNIIQTPPTLSEAVKRAEAEALRKIDEHG